MSIPDDMDIEIRRLDMCYNQFFIDKNQALSYSIAERNKYQIRPLIEKQF